jgi:hypothetical protein
VSGDVQNDLCKIKRTHCVQPLRAYEGNTFIEPNDVVGIIGNALVEIHFSLKHYRIQREGQKSFDSFTSNIEQINVLRRGIPKAPNPYKRQNPREGPFQVKRLKTLMAPTETHELSTEGMSRL